MKRDYIGGLFCGMPPSKLCTRRNDVHIFVTSWFIAKHQQTKLNILKLLAIILTLTLLLGINEQHRINTQKQIDTIKHQQLLRQMKRLEIENRQLKFEVVKARQVRSVMRRYGCYDHRIFKACMDQPYLKPVEAAIFVAIESEFNPNVTSQCGARGAMQICDCWGLKNPYDIKTNIEFGCKLYRRYLDKYKTWDLAIAAYNAGSGAVQEWGGVPPYEETLAYIAVFKRMNRIYGAAV